MHNLRTDRISVNRNLTVEAPIDQEAEKYLRAVRDAEMPALRSAADLIATIEFTDQSTLHPALVRLIETWTKQQAEAWDAMSKPKASRRPAFLKECIETTSALLATLEKVSAQLAAAVNHSDPVIDQLLSIKQTA